MRGWSVGVLLGVALACAALAIPGAAAADVCPPGQSGTPPYCTTPPPPPTCPAGQVGTPPNCVVPAFSATGTKISGRKVTVTFETNAAGTVTVSGKGVATISVGAPAGQVKVKLSLTSAAKQALRTKGKVRLKLTALYQPDGAAALTQNLTVVVKKPGKGHKHHR